MLIPEGGDHWGHFRGCLSHLGLVIHWRQGCTKSIGECRIVQCLRPRLRICICLAKASYRAKCRFKGWGNRLHPLIRRAAQLRRKEDTGKGGEPCPFFAKTHTVFPTGPTKCLVLSSLKAFGYTIPYSCVFWPHLCLLPCQSSGTNSHLFLLL